MHVQQQQQQQHTCQCNCCCRRCCGACRTCPHLLLLLLLLWRHRLQQLRPHRVPERTVSTWKQVHWMQGPPGSVPADTAWRILPSKHTDWQALHQLGSQRVPTGVLAVPPDVGSAIPGPPGKSVGQVRRASPPGWTQGPRQAVCRHMCCAGCPTTGWCSPATSEARRAAWASYVALQHARCPRLHAKVACIAGVHHTRLVCMPCSRVSSSYS